MENTFPGRSFQSYFTRLNPRNTNPRNVNEPLEFRIKTIIEKYDQSKNNLAKVSENKLSLKVKDAVPTITIHDHQPISIEAKSLDK